MGRTETKNQIPQLRAWGRRGLTNHVSNLNKCTDEFNIHFHLLLIIDIANFK